VLLFSRAYQLAGDVPKQVTVTVAVVAHAHDGHWDVHCVFMTLPFLVLLTSLVLLLLLLLLLLLQLAGCTGR
jgi:hypothetical protein